MNSFLPTFCEVTHSAVCGCVIFAYLVGTKLGGVVAGHLHNQQVYIMLITSSMSPAMHIGGKIHPVNKGRGTYAHAILTEHFQHVRTFYYIPLA